MIKFLLVISLIAIFLVSFWIISKIIILNNSVKRMILDTYILEQRIVIGLDKIKRTISPKPISKKKNSIKFFDILLLAADTALTLIYKHKYERIKDCCEFLKNTLA